MPKDIKDIIEFIQSGDNIKRVRLDTDRYLVYNGQLRQIIEKAILKEFLLPETVRELNARIVPLNITQKIIEKLSTVYRMDPIREPISGNESDQELLDMYVNKMDFNQRMKHANRYFRLHKHVMLEPFLSKDGMPKMRVNPSQTYTPFGFDPLEPECPSMIVKHVNLDTKDRMKSRFEIWTDEEFKIVDGEGTIKHNEMAEMGNVDGINPYGVLPFTYINSSHDQIIPISDDDLLNMSVIIPLLLSDLTFGSKFQAWSIIAIIGADDANLSLNPNSVINLPIGPNGEKPSIETIKPQLDIKEMLEFIESLVGMLLTTKNLSVGTVTGQLTVGNAGSGIAKMIDRSESVEDRQDTIGYFDNAEKDFWEKFAHKILPVWVESGNMDPKCVGRFSDDFELSIKFPETRALLGEEERIRIQLAKMNNGLTSRRRAIEELNPTFGEDQVEQLMFEIKDEEMEMMSGANVPSGSESE